jgi:aromatic ring-opening dioxygenase catalytic subunit (LigB family)
VVARDLLVKKGSKRKTGRAMTTMPTFYIPHGGGPCFFMDWTMGPPSTWDRLAEWLRGLKTSLPRPPKALLVVSAHWEAKVPTILAAAKPPLLFDYYGFPKHTYELTWPAPGSPEIAKCVADLLATANIASRTELERGFDHGVFVPLKVAWPDAEIPTVQLSLQEGLDPETHLAIGRALSPLRKEDVLIIGSGMSFHDMRGFMTGRGKEHSTRFDAWLTQVVEDAPAARDRALGSWAEAPSGRESHPREEHLLPLMVAAGAAGDDRGSTPFRDEVMGVVVSAVRFG